MPLMEPSGYGLLIRKGSRTRTTLQALKEGLASAKYEEDEHLVLCRLGGGYQLPGWIERLENAGLQRGQDFVVIADSSMSTEGGVQGDTPEWLIVNLLPSGNPPELEAKMDEEVRAMWQLTRRRLYSLNLSASPREA